MKRSEIRQAVWNFFQIPQNRFSAKIWLTWRGIQAGFISFLALGLQQSFLILVALAGLAFLYLYVFVAKGR